MTKIKNQKSKKIIQGFTLIELLVVISIIGILISLGVARYAVAERGARDTQRMSDLNQYRVALENYASANSMAYPIATGTITNLCTLGATTFEDTYLAGKCLQDPVSLDTVDDYSFYSDGTNYSLYTKLESGVENTYYIVCSSGRSGKMVGPTLAVACPAIP